MKWMVNGFGLATILMGVSAHAQEAAPDEGAGSEEAPVDEEAPADEAEPAEEAEQAEPKKAEEEAEPTGKSSKEGADGARFRFGVAGGAGPLTTEGLGLTYFGADLRFGVQLNDAIGIYAQPQMGYYKVNGADAVVGSGGLIGASLVGDYTFVNRFFVGAGLGYAILNNPSGLELHFRAGGYPLMAKSKEKVRRKGLMLGVDFRLHFVEGYTFIAPTFNLGYEAF